MFLVLSLIMPPIFFTRITKDMTRDWYLSHADQDGQQLQSGLTVTAPLMEAAFFADGIGQYLGAITANCQVARAFAKDYSVTETSIAWGGNAGDDSTQGTGISDDGATGENR